jgi:uncharacterized delta-60 repeat protein
MALARYNPGGGLDPTFGVGGKVVTDFGGADNGTEGGLSIQPDGKIVVGGDVFRGGTASYDFAVYRYLANGNLDTTFSGDGKAIANFVGSDTASVLGLTAGANPMIIVGGHNFNGSNFDFAVARFKPNGGLDPTFGTGGKVITEFGGNDLLWGFVGVPDGSQRFVMVGRSITSISRFAIARYNANGSLDTSFNGTGTKVFAVVPGVHSFAGDAVVEPPPSGKIVVSGGSGPSTDMALVRLKSNGSFDPTFSGDGKVTIDFVGGSDFAWVVRRQTDGKYVLGGFAGVSSLDFGLARVLK